MVEGVNFTVYRSSAGSGKTYSLVQEYILLALKDRNPMNFTGVLAVTFTNKAANEMKVRVLKYLAAFADDNYKEAGLSAMHQVLKERLEINDSELKQRASNTLSAILHRYSSFSITTIDKFVYNIIRSFSFDLKMPFSAEVETDSDSILDHAINELIARVGIDDQLTNMLVEYAVSKIDEEKSWDVQQNLFDFSKQLLKEEGQQNVRKLNNLSSSDFDKIKKRALAFSQSFRSKVEKIGQEAMESIDQYHLADKDFFQGARGIHGFFKKLKEFDDENLVPNKNVLKTIEEDKWYSGKASEEARSNIDAIKPKLENLFDKAQKELKDLPQYYFCAGLLQTFVGMALLNEIEKLIHRYYAENNVVHISEFNKRIAEIVKNEPAPFIYERIGEKYHHFLIDEFQDTSILQWSNLLPLVDESLSKGKFNLLVGDGKQAIYRWRDGEVEQFSSLPKLHPKPSSQVEQLREDVLHANYQQKLLQHNFRSKKEIVDFNNTFFATASTMELDETLQDVYSKAEQVPVKESGGYVSVQQYEPTEENESYSLEATLDYVKKAIQDGFQLSEITVLVRKNEEAVEIAEYLTQKEIEVISAESLLLSSSQKVQLVINVLKHLHNHEDKLTKVQVVSLLNIFSTREEDWHENIKKAAIGNLPDQIKQLNPSLPLFQLVEEIIHVFFPKQKADPFLLTLLEFVYQFTKKSNRSLYELLQEWELKKGKLSISMPEGINAVNISTIHKAKGLEYPVVIIPFADWHKTKAKDYLWIQNRESGLEELPVALLPFNKKLEQTAYESEYLAEKNKNELDHLNLLYVAFTRASQRLHVIAANDKYKQMGVFINKVMQQAFPGWDGEFYEAGKLAPSTKKEENRRNHKVLEDIVSTSWQEKVSIAYTAKEEWEKEEESSHLSYGKMVHELFALLDSLSDLPNVLKKIQVKYNLSSEVLSDLEEKTGKLLQNQVLANCFEANAKTYNESELLLEGGTTFRPDKVVMLEDKTIVVDYKTGAKREEHKEQVANYCSILQQMSYPNVEGVLAYFDTSDVERV